MSERLPEIGGRWREGSSPAPKPAPPRLDQVVVQLARELQQTQAIAQAGMADVERELARVAERLERRVEACEQRCDLRLRAVEDGLERVASRLEAALDRTAAQVRARAADDAARVQSWLTAVSERLSRSASSSSKQSQIGFARKTRFFIVRNRETIYYCFQSNEIERRSDSYFKAISSFTAQIDECRERQERDRDALADELLALQDAAGDRHRALRAVVERQGEARVAFEKGFRLFLARYQAEIEDVLGTVRDNRFSTFSYLLFSKR